MWELIGLAGIILGIIAIKGLRTCRKAVERQEERLNSLEKELANVGKLLGAAPEKKTVLFPTETEAEKIPEASETIQEVERPVEEHVETPSEFTYEEAELPETVEPALTGPETTEQTMPSAIREGYIPSQKAATVGKRTDMEWWSKLEEAVGKRWITWVGAIVLFLGVALFVKYAFDQKWLGPTARVLIGVIGGICVTAAGERFVRRQMRALGQGLIGAGLAILYVSLYAAYGLYQFLPQSAAFGFMIIVTIIGLVLAVIHNAIPISFLAVLGGFLTPIMLSTGQDTRDTLFSYLLLLDIGVLGIAWFKRWRAIDVLAFIGTWALFTGWYMKFHEAPTFSLVPTLLWLIAFYMVFLIQPFIYHLRLATPIVGERFILAVSNAMGMFGWAYTILHEEHKHILGFITLGMSVSYLILGVLTRRRIKTDERAVFGFIALSVALFIIAVPIHLDFQGVTIAWAVEAPLLLYLAYRYSYFPVRVGSLVPLALAASRIFTNHWPMHEKAFAPVLNSIFGTAMFVTLAGAAYAIIHQSQRKDSRPADRVLKITTGIASSFLALIIIHTEIWQWLDFSGRKEFVRWAAALVWATGAAGFLAAGLKMRSVHSRISGFAALATAGILCIWDYGVGIQPDSFLIFNGRFFAALAVILIIFAYAYAYRRSREVCSTNETCLSTALYGLGIFLLVVQMCFETWQWLALREHYYIGRCVLPLLCAAGAFGYLAACIRLRSNGLLIAGAAMLGAAVVLAGIGYKHHAPADYIMFFNLRFAAGLAVAIMFFVYAFMMRFFSQLIKQSWQLASIAFYGTGIFLLIILVSEELWLWLTKHDYYYIARCVLPLIWSAGAAGYLGTGMKLRSLSLRLAGLAVLGAACIFAASGYKHHIDSGYFLLFNGRFAAAFVLSLMFFIYAFSLRKFGAICQPDEKYVSEALHGLGILSLVLFVSVEVWLWFFAHEYRYLARCLLPLIWAGGTAGYLVSGIKLQTARLRYAGLWTLFVAGTFSIYGYTFDMERGYLLFLNERFFAAIAVVLMIFADGYVLRYFRELCEQHEKITAKVLYGIGITLLFILLNVEMFLYFSTSISDPARARWATQMSLSILWAVYATVLLAIGFWRGARVLRLSSLGLFCVTALKVVIMDMANVEQVYRIVSFMVLGALMIGASYLYHRVEKRLSISSKPE